MKTSLTKGIIRTVLYYIIGFASVFFLSLIPGVNYGHGPGLHHVIGFLILCGGAGWAIYSFVRVIRNKNDTMNLAALILNVIVVGGVFLYFSIIINHEASDDIPIQKEDIITVKYDSTTKRSSVVNGFGDTILLKVGDSVLIDKIDKASK